MLMALPHCDRVPVELSRLLDEEFMGVRVFTAHTFPSGAIYSDPEFGRDIAFPNIEKKE